MICVIDCGLGNINSVIRMINKVGGQARSVSQPEEVLEAEKLILPGVGHFDNGMNRIREGGLYEPLIKKITEGHTPILGICLGMQMLCTKSEEGDSGGLGVIDAEVRRFSFDDNSNLKIPHMGWNEIEVPRENAILESSSAEQRYYFVHSFHVCPQDQGIVIAYADYGLRFCAAFQQGQIFGVQFHPEKSHSFGMDLMRKFSSL
jgi:glutamine amidotransferase